MEHKNEVLEPEVYFLPPTPYCPNSPLPVLVYRNVLPRPIENDSIQQWVESHGWDRQGAIWPAIYRRHFHPNAHEMYPILSGSSTTLHGVGTSDGVEANPDMGVRIFLQAGDVIVHPAGTGHSNITETDDELGPFKYMSFFPRGAPRYKTKPGVELLDIDAVREEYLSIPMPEDPVTGGEGWLQPIWKRAAEQWRSEQSSGPLEPTQGQEKL